MRRSIRPELYVFYEDGSELFTFTWYEENVGENLWQYGYPDEGFGWENVTEAYLSFTNYGWAEDDSTVDSYYEVRVNITEAFSGYCIRDRAGENPCRCFLCPLPHIVAGGGMA